MATRNINSLTQVKADSDLVEQHAFSELKDVEKDKARAYEKPKQRFNLVQPIMGGILIVTLAMMLIGIFH